MPDPECHSCGRKLYRGPENYRTICLPCLDGNLEDAKEFEGDYCIPGSPE